MGKPKPLKSSMKTIQEVITSFNPVAPICLQQSRTQSFRRDGLHPASSFNSVYYTPPSTSLSSSPTTSASISFSSADCRQHPPLPVPTVVEDHGNSSTGSVDVPARQPTGPINSTRFFFSPTTTKSIMEEDKAQMGHRRTRSCGDVPVNDSPGDVADGPCFCEDNARLVVSSDDPYEDFKTSMEEMVKAHGIRDWSELQQLLQCYLSLNDKNTHNVIMLAFVDILMHSLSSSSQDHHHESCSFSSLPCPPPRPQLCFHRCVCSLFHSYSLR